MALKSESKLVTASISINFEPPESSNDGYLSWEIDDRSEDDGGMNKGDTSFAPGDDVGLLLFKESSVELKEDPWASGGAVSKDGTTVYEFNDEKQTTEYITVENSSTANLNKPANVDTPKLSWLGKSKKIGNGDPTLEMFVDPVTKERSEVVIDLGTEMVGVIKAQYKSEATKYWLKKPPKDFPVVVVFAMGTIGEAK